MPSSTRSNKETQLLFSSGPASLECSIRKRIRSSSIDNNTCSSLDFRQPPSIQTPVSSTDTRSPPSTEDTLLPSTDIFYPTSIDTLVRTSIDTEPRDMVATLLLVRDEKGDMHDQEGHMRNAAGQRIDAQGAAIPEARSLRSDRALARARSLRSDQTEWTLGRYAERTLGLYVATGQRACAVVAYMPSSTRSNKETQLLFSSDPASLERSIRKGIRSSSIDNNTCSSFDFRQPLSTQTPVSSTDTRSPPSTEDTLLPSTDIFNPTSIDTSVRTSIDTEPRDMVATLILVRDERGDLHDQEGHLRSAVVMETEHVENNASEFLSAESSASEFLSLKSSLWWLSPRTPYILAPMSVYAFSSSALKPS
ncbi:hypothetical protein F2Q68_00015608 [Brassica cretica]|uniref:Uncharacterized protein n=1 Tax=Brassica cretica TaxID=69181 RepID=A0A8S9HK61_BRACR|nr:hypothetical protein F2Q68_00015608 [Brassica cretica]